MYMLHCIYKEFYLIYSKGGTMVGTRSLPEPPYDEQSSELADQTKPPIIVQLIGTHPIDLDLDHVFPGKGSLTTVINLQRNKTTAVQSATTKAIKLMVHKNDVPIAKGSRAGQRMTSIFTPSHLHDKKMLATSPVMNNGGHGHGKTNTPVGFKSLTTPQIIPVLSKQEHDKPKVDLTHHKDIPTTQLASKFNMKSPPSMRATEPSKPIMDNMAGDNVAPSTVGTRTSEHKHPEGSIPQGNRYMRLPASLTVLTATEAHGAFQTNEAASSAAAATGISSTTNALATVATTLFDVTSPLPTMATVTSLSSTTAMSTVATFTSQITATPLTIATVTSLIPTTSTKLATVPTPITTTPTTLATVPISILNNPAKVATVPTSISTVALVSVPPPITIPLRMFQVATPLPLTPIPSFTTMRSVRAANSVLTKGASTIPGLQPIPVEPLIQHQTVTTQSNAKLQHPLGLSPNPVWTTPFTGLPVSNTPNLVTGAQPLNPTSQILPTNQAMVAPVNLALEATPAYSAIGILPKSYSSNQDTSATPRYVATPANPALPVHPVTPFSPKAATQTYPATQAYPITQSFPAPPANPALPVHPVTPFSPIAATQTYPATQSYPITQSFPAPPINPALPGYPVTPFSPIAATQTYPATQAYPITQSFPAPPVNPALPGYPVTPFSAKAATQTYQTTQAYPITQSFLAAQANLALPGYQATPFSSKAITQSNPFTQAYLVTQSFPATQANSATQAYSASQANPATQSHEITQAFPATQSYGVTKAYPATQAYPTLLSSPASYKATAATVRTTQRY
jgi:hypothetical protein